MTSLLDQTFYGNTIVQYAVSAAIVIGALVVGKTIYWLSKNVLRALTARSRATWDDLLLDMVEEPIIFAVTGAGIWYGLARLEFPEAIDNVVAHGAQFILVLAVTWFLARLLDGIFKRHLTRLAQRSETDLDDQILPVARRASRIAVWSIGIIVALNNAGANVAGLLAGLGIGGLAFALAARDTVSNVFGGFTIFADQPFKLNDRVRAAGFDGHIREIGLRSTRLQTLDGTIVTIPNAKFTDAPVENVTREPSRKVKVQIGLVYDTPPAGIEQALTILREIVDAHDDTEETVGTYFAEFGDSALGLLLVYYIKSGADIMATQSAVNLAILERFNAAGLEMAFPTRTLYLAGGGGDDAGELEAAG